jgi:catalase
MVSHAVVDSASATGTGWEETFLGGSKEREEALIAKRFVPEINRMQNDVRRLEGRRSVARALHNKMLAGTTNAEFQVLPDIPEDLRVGLFQPGKSYPAYVRFSNASSFEQPDLAYDLRGIAIRVRTSEGSEATDKDHDFLMTSAPVSHARNALQFMVFAGAGARAGQPAMLWRMRGWRLVASIARTARRLGFREAVRIVLTLQKQTSHHVASLASEHYWSRAPFAFGPVAVKFKVEPTAKATEEQKKERATVDLREELRSRLRKGAVQFDFKVQRYVNSETTPIEDETVEWKEGDAPFITIARLAIPKQELNAEEEAKIDRCAFNPWNVSSDDFRPLGSMNRARKLVYYASAKLRSEK